MLNHVDVIMNIWGCPGARAAGVVQVPRIGQLLPGRAGLGVAQRFTGHAVAVAEVAEIHAIIVNLSIVLLLARLAIGPPLAGATPIPASRTEPQRRACPGTSRGDPAPSCAASPSSPRGVPLSAPSLGQRPGARTGGARGNQGLHSHPGPALLLDLCLWCPYTLGPRAGPLPALFLRNSP